MAPTIRSQRPGFKQFAEIGCFSMLWLSSERGTWTFFANPHPFPILGLPSAIREERYESFRKPLPTWPRLPATRTSSQYYGWQALRLSREDRYQAPKSGFNPPLPGDQWIDAWASVSGTEHSNMMRELMEMRGGLGNIRLFDLAKLLLVYA
jgi:hypothetical protein